ncbi:hypothetical protein EDC96DRAFT_525993 [Choanephora cucurbitarum]|uniref:Uncharacterized protein n=1 Tax=Choanephora cucurbitarum TaxID=101091 RepID=A0A1C7N3F4_9FUNG|nr:hypothetical protein EDC96DRAFT_525993 [Choanephora cucurbitarum]OBZ83169.1 hypothetical protein A0J61_08780 [Choanephora cucurbitarum]
MPFRCKCGRTFEKTDTFASHTSSCAPFHHRRMSDTTQLSTNSMPVPSTPHRQSLPFVNPSFSRGLLSTSPQSVSSTQSILDTPSSDLSSSAPSNTFFMPTALSLQNAFEGARRRSMSYGSSLK